MKLRKLLSFSLLFVALVVCLTSPVFANSALSATQGEVLKNENIVDGVQWKKYKAQTTNDAGETGNQVVNMASIAPGSAQVISWAIPNGNGIKPSTLLQAAADFEATYPDYQVIAGINNDYFGSNASGVFSMRNTSVVDGVVFYQRSQYNQMYGLAIKENNEYILTKPGGQIEISENYYLDVYDATGVYVIDTYELSGFNSTPAQGETTVIYEKEVQANGFEIFEIETTCNSRVESVYYFEGKYSATVEATTTESVAVATANLKVANAIESGAKIRIYKTTAGAYADYDYVLGCPAQTMKDGTILSVEEIKDYGYDHVSLRHPRTSIGFKEDGTMVIMVVDGRQADKGMDGVSERENALLLKNLGCVNSFNFDGGGSSTFAVLINGELTVTNSPSDGGLRSDANHLLVVVPRMSVEYDVTQELTEDGKVVVSGKANVTCNNGFTYSNATLLVDGVNTGQSADNFSVELNKGEEYHLGLAITYKNGSTTTTKGMGYQAFTTIGSANEEVVVSEPKVKFNLSQTGFTVNVDFESGKEYVTKVQLEYEGKTPVVRKTFTGFMASIVSKAEKEYQFKLTYTYRTAIGESKEVVVENISYTYGEEQVDLDQLKEEAYNSIIELATPYLEHVDIKDSLALVLEEFEDNLQEAKTKKEIEELKAAAKEMVDAFIAYVENIEEYLAEFKEEANLYVDEVVANLEMADFGKAIFADIVKQYKDLFNKAETLNEMKIIMEEFDELSFEIANPGKTNAEEYRKYVIYSDAVHQYAELENLQVDEKDLTNLNEDYMTFMEGPVTVEEIDHYSKQFRDNVDRIANGQDYVPLTPIEPVNPEVPPKTNNCAFGASVISSFILLGALLVLINKRR